MGRDPRESRTVLKLKLTPESVLLLTQCDPMSSQSCYHTPPLDTWRLRFLLPSELDVAGDLLCPM